jgi:hypothetical protein
MKGLNPTNLVNTLLMLYVVGNIIMGVANVAVWVGSPSSQASLLGGPVAKTLGSLAGLAVGSAILSAASFAFAVGVFGLSQKQKWAPLIIVAVAIANRLLSLLIFQATYAIFYAGTVFLVCFALLDYWLINRPT